MQADERMQRLGRGQDPESVEARAAAFLAEGQPRVGLSQAEVAAIEQRLLRNRRPALGVRLWPALAAVGLLLAAGSVLAVAGGWRPRLPFLDEGPSPGPNRPAGPRSPRKVAYTPPPPAVPILANESAPSVAPAAATPPVRRASRPPSVPSTATVAADRPETSPLSVEARSLADALARWRRDGDAEGALALLAAHDRRFAGGVLAVEVKVARAEILLSVGRRGPALGVLDSLALPGLPRARELSTLRGELRAEAGRCAEARGDLGRVLQPTARDELDRRARAALARCPER